MCTFIKTEDFSFLLNIFKFKRTDSLIYIIYINQLEKEVANKS